jgi:hypothetical protein
MKLPNPKKASVPKEKLADYCLNLNHPKGKNKARVFKSALGLTTDDWEYLRDVLLEIVKTYCAFYKGCNRYGNQYEIDFRLREVSVRSCWIVHFDEDFPRLTSCYVKNKEME